MGTTLPVQNLTIAASSLKAVFSRGLAARLATGSCFPRRPILSLSLLAMSWLLLYFVKHKQKKGQDQACQNKSVGPEMLKENNAIHLVDEYITIGLISEESLRQGP